MYKIQQQNLCAEDDEGLGRKQAGWSCSSKIVAACMSHLMHVLKLYSQLPIAALENFQVSDGDLRRRKWSSTTRTKLQVNNHTSIGMTPDM